MSKTFDGYVLVSDMDGTLIGSDKIISSDNREAIDYFINEGGLFTVATGRMLPSVLEYRESLNLNLPILIHNGGKIYDVIKEEIISEVYIEGNRKEAIKRIANDYPSLGIEIFSDEVVYVYQSCRFTERYNRHNYEIVYDVDDSLLRDLTQHLTTRADDDHAPPVNPPRREAVSLRPSGTCQAQVRFFALHRINPHAPPLVRAPVNFFEF